MDHVERALGYETNTASSSCGAIYCKYLRSFNIITGITKKCFVLSLHINCGLLYYFMSALDFRAGLENLDRCISGGTALQ